MDIKTRLLRCCGIDLGGGNKCHDGLRCNNCFDKLEGWREIERLREAVIEIVYRIGQGDTFGAMDIAAPIAIAALKETE